MSDNIVKRTKVTLIKDGLTHQGVARKTGGVIEATDRQLEFLAKREFIAQPKGGKPITTTPEA